MPNLHFTWIADNKEKLEKKSITAWGDREKEGDGSLGTQCNSLSFTETLGSWPLCQLKSLGQGLLSLTAVHMGR